MAPVPVIRLPASLTASRCGETVASAKRRAANQPKGQLNRPEPNTPTASVFDLATHP